jgi:predicted HicB family RNase H-like nuclease
MSENEHTPPAPAATPGRQRTQQREVPHWEYETAYDWKFQLRTSPELHRRLSERAAGEGRTLESLVIALLEEAVARGRPAGR